MDDEADRCWACIVGFHDECYAPDIMLGVDPSGEDGPTTHWIICCCAKSKIDDAAAFATEKRGVGRPMLDPDEITDPLSTGRKRARMMAPILDGMLCEWAGLKYAGGGVVPIVGCDSNVIVESKGSDGGHRHHGPDKNVLNNTPGVNLHRVCTSCHLYWHGQNNRYYIEPRPAVGQTWVPTAPEGMTVQRHDPDTLATDEEIEEAHAGRKNMRVVLDNDE